jgi:hypothetical protein
VPSAPTGTDCSPNPKATTAEAGSSIPSGADSRVEAASSSIPDMLAAKPATATQPSPRRRVSAGAAAAPTTIPALSGSNAIPA